MIFPPQGLTRRCAIFVWLVLCLGRGVRPAAAWQQEPQTLKIAEIFFEDYDGFPTPSFQMKAGGDVVVTFRVQGFARLTERAESGLPEDQVSLQHEVELRDPGGPLVQPAETGEVETTLSTRDEQWTPKIRWTAAVPLSAPSGTYQVRIRVKDRIKEQSAEAAVQFRVQGETLPASSGLEIQQLEYARSASGPWFSERPFSPQDPIYVRYRIAGFAVSPAKEVWVEQDWTLFDAEGRVLVSRENAAVEKLQAFYPPRFLSAFFDLTLDNPRPGAYRLHIELRDRIGRQTASADSRFVLRP